MDVVLLCLKGVCAFVVVALVMVAVFAAGFFIFDRIDGTVFGRKALRRLAEMKYGIVEDAKLAAKTEREPPNHAPFSPELDESTDYLKAG